MITIDGKQGEGGGQVLRTSLSLSAVTGKQFRIFDIRANRRNPGLQKQHLQSVIASAKVCGGECGGAILNSSELVFKPGTIKGGHFKFDIKSAGSTSLVLQTILPILLKAESESTVVIRGGTHNPMGPPFEFIRDAFLPTIGLLGFKAEVSLVSHGFYPKGGGEIRAVVHPVGKEKAEYVDLNERGEIRRVRPKVIIANLPLHIAERERAVVAKELGCSEDDVEVEMLPGESGPGNVVMISAQMGKFAMVFTSYGERGKQAEKVAREACDAYKVWRVSGAMVCSYLADQVLIYMALAGGGSYTTNEVTEHFRTNADVIKMFCEVDIRVEVRDGGMQRVWVS